MPTLPELTLQLSRDLSLNHQNCLRQLEQLEASRMTALQGLPGTAAILQEASEDRLEAALTRDRTLEQIDLDLQKAERKAAAARQTALQAVEKRFHDRDVAALHARTAGEEKERAHLKAEYEKIAASLDLSQQILARREAERRCDEAIRALHATYLKTLSANKDRHVDEQREVLQKELLDSRLARDEAEAARHAVEQVHQRALKAAETRMRARLELAAGASTIQADFDSRRDRTKLECRQREEALFAAFRKAKEGLMTKE
jgi:hypothetical protein